MFVLNSQVALIWQTPAATFQTTLRVITIISIAEASDQQISQLYVCQIIFWEIPTVFLKSFNLSSGVLCVLSRNITGICEVGEFMVNCHLML